MGSIVTVRADDAVLHHVAPLGLAAALARRHGAALVVDLDPGSPPYPGRSLADLVRDGARRADLVPGRRGVAVLGNGGLSAGESGELLGRLAEGWPVVVGRVGERVPGLPLVPVRALLPPPLVPVPDGPAVYQALSPGARPPGAGVLLPPLGRARLRALLSGVVDPRWRWVRAWDPVGRARWR